MFNLYLCLSTFFNRLPVSKHHTIKLIGVCTLTGIGWSVVLPASDETSFNASGRMFAVSKSSFSHQIRYASKATGELNVGEWSTSCSSRFTTWEISPVPIG
jgi:hypothetical protein